MHLFIRCLVVIIAWTFSFNSFAIVKRTEAERGPQSVGHYWGGHLVGGKALPVQGEGYTLIRLERHNNYGHEVLIDFVQRLSQKATAHNLGSLWIGDLSARRGGRLAANHRSHQNGLDVDIFFYGEKSLQSASVVGGKTGVNKLWKPEHGELIRLTSEESVVERIFVNQGIKKHLCKQYKGASWLSKVRAAKGHANHIHVRLSCPADSHHCEAQGQPTGRAC